MQLTFERRSHGLQLLERGRRLRSLSDGAGSWSNATRPVGRFGGLVERYGACRTIRDLFTAVGLIDRGNDRTIARYQSDYDRRVIDWCESGRGVIDWCESGRGVIDWCESGR